MSWSRRGGVVYVLQSYSVQVDPKQSEGSLRALGGRLQLPHGWQFRARQLAQDWVVRVDGVACVIQDEFENTYQRVESPAP